MAAEMVEKLVDTTLEQYPASRLVGITVLAVGAICLAFHLVRSYTPSNRLELFKQALQGVEKVYGDSTGVLLEYGQADRIGVEVRR
jgi:hypothetical protein